jgi:ribosome maturation factor RimP
MSIERQREEVERMVRGVVSERFPGVEVYDVELRGGRSSAVTVYIDRPGGVDLDLCAQVSTALEELRERHALEVSSPGLDRRLRRPEHFRGVTGQTVTLHTRTPVEGRSGFRGTVTEAADKAVTLALEEGGNVTVDYDNIARANLVYRFESHGAQDE